MVPIYMDGGQSVRNIVTKVRELSGRFNEWALGLEPQ